MNTTFARVQELAMMFLDIAEELNEKVSAFFDGSNDAEDEDAYHTVKSAEVAFINAYNSYYDDNAEACLNYDLAESVL